MRPIRWDLSDDRGRSLDGGTVFAESDADALRAVLSGDGGAVRGLVGLNRAKWGLKADRWYRIKAGSATASAAGDEFGRTAEAASMPGDTAAEAALQGRLEEEMAGRAGRGWLGWLEAAGTVDEAGGLPVPGPSIRRHRPVQSGVKAAIEPDPLLRVRHLSVTVGCRDCGRQYRAHAALPDTVPSSADAGLLQSMGRQAWAGLTNGPCGAVGVDPDLLSAPGPGDPAKGPQTP